MSESDLPADDETAPAIRIAYGDDPNQFGMLRIPDAIGPHPVVVFIHGGFWRAAYDFAYAEPLCVALTRQGIATWNLEYRRVGQAGGGWPGTLQDVATGVDRLRKIALRYHLNLNRVVTLGHSAGGHLALWLAARQRLSADHELSSAEPLALHATIALAGVVDLRLGWEMHLGNDAVGALLGGTPTGVPERYAGASPAELLPLGVPQFLIYGTEDRVVPLAIGEHYNTAAQTAGDDVTLITQQGSGHFELVTAGTEEWEEVVTTVFTALGMAQER